MEEYPLENFRGVALSYRNISIQLKSTFKEDTLDDMMLKAEMQILVLDSEKLRDERTKGITFQPMKEKS